MRSSFPTGKDAERPGAHRGLPEGFCACPIDTAFEVLGRKWSIQLLRSLLAGDRHFNQFLEHVEGLNPKTLSARLKDLAREKLVAKNIVQTSPIKIQYELTEKGYAILPILRDMARWSFQWAPEKVFENGKRPKEMEECLERWQSSLVATNTKLHVKRASGVVEVSLRRPQGPKRPSP